MKNKLILNEYIKRNSIIIIDFFNLYCNLVKFNKFKIFSKDTFEICIKKIIDTLKYHAETIIIVSKNIFEVNNEFIENLLLKYNFINVIYVIVQDMSIIKSQNKERDDYICFLFNSYLQSKNKNVYILSNDKFKNYHNIISNVKPVKLHFINTNLNSDFENELKSVVCNDNLNRIGFRFN